MLEAHYKLPTLSAELPTLSAKLPTLSGKLPTKEASGSQR